MKRMKLLLPALLVAIVFLSTHAYAQPKGTLMGGLVSIVSDGPFDVSRNPALLSLQTSQNAAGVFIRLRPYDKHEYCVEAPIEIDRGQPKVIYAGGMAAYSRKSGSSSWGFALGEVGNDLVSYSKTKMRTFNTMMSPIVIADYETEETLETNPMGFATYALRLSDADAVGFQVCAGYSYKKTSKIKDTYVDSLLVGKLTKNDRIIGSVKFSGGIGYLHSTADSQVGLLLKPGVAVIENEKYNYTFIDLADGAPGSMTSPPAPDDSRSAGKSTADRFMYAKGMSITVGGYQKLSPLFGLAFEAEFTPENSYTDRNLDIDGTAVYDDEVSGYRIVSSKDFLTAKNSVVLRGGVEISPYDGISFFVGGGYNYQDISIISENDEGKGQTQGKMEFFYTTFGVNYNTRRDINFAFIVFTGKIVSDYRVEKNSFSIRMKDTYTLLDAGIAVTTAF